jgi:predicted nucleotide-binding protein
MGRINARLLAAIMDKTGLSKSQVYARIGQVANRDHLPRSLAAIKFAADYGVNINKYASAEDLAQLRQTGSPVTPPVELDTYGGPDPWGRAAYEKNLSAATPRHARKPARTSRRRLSEPAKASRNQVFVVHGRDTVAKEAIFAFLRSVSVKPIEWNAAIGMTKKPSPYVAQILAAAFTNARAVVVLLTPDDLAQLREDLITRTDPAFEKRLTGQARPNVLFEAGMAFSSHPDRTVLVQVGNIRPFSDTAGRHVVHMSNDAGKRQELATKLENAGCDVDRSGTDWLKAGDFTDPEARTPTKRSKKRR